MERYSTVVVGAGPAGAMLAERLISLSDDMDILVLERRSESSYHDYHRMCAEGISRTAYQLTNAPLEGIVKNRVTKVREVWPGGIALENDIDGLVIDRPALLRFLMDRFRSKGGLFIEGELNGIINEGKSFRLELTDGTNCSCRYLVGADGAHSLVRRSWFGSIPQVMMPVEQYLVDQEGPMDELLLRYDQKYGGKYWWRFPSSGWSKIGFPAGSEAAPKNYYERHARTIPIGRVPELVKGNCALIGDAAGMANPLTFGGLRTSFSAALMLAEAIAQNDLERYEAAWSSSDMADPCFLESFNLIRSLSNPQLADLVRPLRYGPNMTAVMDGLLNQEGFGRFYRGHVRKLSAGW